MLAPRAAPPSLVHARIQARCVGPALWSDRPWPYVAVVFRVAFALFLNGRCA